MEMKPNKEREMSPADEIFKCWLWFVTVAIAIYGPIFCYQMIDLKNNIDKLRDMEWQDMLDEIENLGDEK
jgi:hypothetical protein